MRPKPEPRRTQTPPNTAALPAVPTSRPSPKALPHFRAQRPPPRNTASTEAAEMRKAPVSPSVQRLRRDRQTKSLRPIPPDGPHAVPSACNKPRTLASPPAPRVRPPVVRSPVVNGTHRHENPSRARGRGRMNGPMPYRVPSAVTAAFGRVSPGVRTPGSLLAAGRSLRLEAQGRDLGKPAPNIPPHATLRSDLSREAIIVDTELAPLGVIIR